MNARTHDALPGRITARTPHPAEHQTRMIERPPDIMGRAAPGT